MDFCLLFVLPDKKNQTILVIKTDNEYQIPAYDKPVGVIVGFDEPQFYNDFFRNLTGISVFRRYSFNTDNYVVFVFEQADEINVVPSNGYDWISYDDFSNCQQTGEKKNIMSNVKIHYNKSINMPWVNEDGLISYFGWLDEVCFSNNIHINGEITQVKNAYVSNVFRIPTDTGNLYMKIPGKVYINELPFTYELKRLGMVDFPVWVDFNLGLNVFLMRDMGGMDLPSHSDINTLKKLIIQLAHTQKDSIKYLPLNCEYNDYRVNSIINNLNDFPQQAFDILSNTQYKITCEEKEKLSQNIKFATELLKSVKYDSIPDIIPNGDVRPGNVRVINDKFILYDWAWGAVSHPFIEVTTFLHIIRRSLPNDIPAKEIIVDTYLGEWLEYGTKDELKAVFTILDDLKELFMAYPDYIWVRDIHSASSEPIEVMSADGWLLERRNYYFESVLRRFIEKNF